MQCELHFGFVAGVRDELVEAWVPGKLQPAANHPLVKAFEPAEAAATFQIDILRMHDVFDRRVPAEFRVSTLDAENAHASSRNDGDGQLSVVNSNQLDAFLLSAVQRCVRDRNPFWQFRPFASRNLCEQIDRLALSTDRNRLSIC